MRYNPGSMPMPSLALRPMLATLADPAELGSLDDGAWGFEFKWDGFRALAHWDGRAFRLMTRNGNDMTARFPPIARIARQLRSAAVLDGEIVALDPAGVPRFGLLQNWSTGAPIAFYVFDLLHLGRRSLMPLPYADRRAELERLGLAGDHWRVPPRSDGPGPAVMAVARGHDLEGVVAKRLDSPYVPGRRSESWLKFKLVDRQEFVVGGYTPGTDRRGIGALLLGYYDGDVLHFAGGMGTGYGIDDRISLLGTLRRIERATSPFAERVMGRPDAVWVEPRLVVEVEFRGWTHEGRLRVPSFQGLRLDKEPSEVVKEEPQRHHVDSG
jgi:bifunctional non-homologous end joining protein LigD